MCVVTADRSVLVVAPTAEPLTLDQVKLRAGQDWVAGDPRDALVSEYLAAARVRVERDTELALLTQTRDAFAQGTNITVVQLPGLCLPVQSVIAVSTVAPDGTLTPLTSFTVDLTRGRVTLAAPLTVDAAGLAHVVVRVIAGWTTPAELAARAPLLVHAVGLLTTHYFTVGRDVVNVGHIVSPTPFGYDDVIETYRQVAVV
jgi:uncharacterized phiE125 gp8 family phage protein